MHLFFAINHSFSTTVLVLIVSISVPCSLDLSPKVIPFGGQYAMNIAFIEEGCPMVKKKVVKSQYSQDFKTQVLEVLENSSKSMAQVAREFEVSYPTLNS